jgi:glucoamylase
MVGAQKFLSLFTSYLALSDGPTVPGKPVAFDIDAYVDAQYPLAKTGLLNNIGPDGAKAKGSKPGVVIASPSTSNPNYLYTWVRDSSLVGQLMVDM